MKKNLKKIRIEIEKEVVPKSVVENHAQNREIVESVQNHVRRSAIKMMIVDVIKKENVVIVTKIVTKIVTRIVIDAVADQMIEGKISDDFYGIK